LAVFRTRSALLVRGGLFIARIELKESDSFFDGCIQDLAFGGIFEIEGITRGAVLFEWGEKIVIFSYIFNIMIKGKVIRNGCVAFFVKLELGNPDIESIFITREILILLRGIGAIIKST
jgi:hypothetical protein